MQAVVLAGGQGTRLRSLVSNVPKPMAPVSGRPFLEHLLDYWITQGVDRAILSVGYMRDLIKNHFGHRYRGCGIEYADEEMPLGTGGAVLNCLPHLDHDSPALVLNGDTFFSVELNRLREFHQKQGAEVTLSLFESDDTARYSGVSLTPEWTIREFSSATPPDSLCLVNGGVFYFSGSTLARLKLLPLRKSSLESDLISGLIQEGTKVCGFLSPAPFIDIGTPEDYLRAPAILTNQLLGDS
jgi:D-glycero-alpha-D-manno-heptose 1-phosphate guanylyltransferase